MTVAVPPVVLMYVDGGYFMNAGRVAPKQITGVYWSVLCEVNGGATAIIRRQSDEYDTNNDAEWLALREGLTYLAENHPTATVVIHSDSMLVVNQFNGGWRSKVERHHRYRTECRALAAQVAEVTVKWVPRKVSVEKLGH